MPIVIGAIGTGSPPYCELETQSPQCISKDGERSSLYTYQYYTEQRLSFNVLAEQSSLDKADSDHSKVSEVTDSSSKGSLSGDFYFTNIFSKEYLMESIDLSRYHQIIILTGAGVSAASGIRSFRGPNGIWNDADLAQHSDQALLKTNPEALWQFYGALRQQAAKAQPNAAHLALAQFDILPDLKARGFPS